MDQHIQWLLLTVDFKEETIVYQSTKNFSQNAQVYSVPERFTQNILEMCLVSLKWI